jgi:hypothetical protein
MFACRFLALVCLMPGLSYGARLEISSVSMSPGGAGAIAISYAAEGSRLSGLQFDIEYDPSVLALIGVPGSSTRAA